MASTARQRRGYAGVNRLRRKLRRMDDLVTEPVREEVERTAQTIHFNQLSLLRSRVKTRTGVLAAALSWRIARDGLTARIGIIGKRAARAAFYARFIEFGTRIMPARPFIHPGFEMERAQFIIRMNRAISRSLKRGMGRPGQG